MSTKSSIAFLSRVRQIDESVHIYSDMMDGKYYIECGDSERIRLPSDIAIAFAKTINEMAETKQQKKDELEITEKLIKELRK